MLASGCAALLQFCQGVEHTNRRFCLQRSLVVVIVLVALVVGVAATKS